MEIYEGNYIKLFRKMTEWGWYKDTATKVLFIHCLLKANWKEADFMGVHLEPGEFATSYTHLAKETGLTVNQVRTALNHLKITREITFKSHGKFSVISIKNWDSYQAPVQSDYNQITNRLQSDHNNRRNKEYKEYKNSSDLSWLERWAEEGDRRDRENGIVNED